MCFSAIHIAILGQVVILSGPMDHHNRLKSWLAATTESKSVIMGSNMMPE